MNIIEEAKILIEKMETGQTVNSQDYGRVYTLITSKKYEYSNCVPCIKTMNNEMKRKIAQMEIDGDCLDCKKQKIKNDILVDNASDSIDIENIDIENKKDVKTKKKK